TNAHFVVNPFAAATSGGREAQQPDRAHDVLIRPGGEVSAMSDNGSVVRGHGLKRLGGTWGECLAEFFGTFVLIAFGDGVVAMVVAALPGSGRTQGPTTFFLGAGDWLLITWGWALAVAFAVYVAGGVRGAHINPA